MQCRPNRCLRETAPARQHPAMSTRRVGLGAACCRGVPYARPCGLKTHYVGCPATRHSVILLYDNMQAASAPRFVSQPVMSFGRSVSSAALMQVPRDGPRRIAGEPTSALRRPGQRFSTPTTAVCPQSLQSLWLKVLTMRVADARGRRSWLVGGAVLVRRDSAAHPSMTWIKRQEARRLKG